MLFWLIIATKTPRYLYSASECSRATYPFHITKYFSHLRPDFYEVGLPIDPEQSSVHYSWLATYCHVCLSLRRGVRSFLPDGYTNIDPLRIRLRTISMSSHDSQLFAGQEMASLHICYGGSNILTSSEYSRPVRLGVWRIRLGRKGNKNKDKR